MLKAIPQSLSSACLPAASLGVRGQQQENKHYGDRKQVFWSHLCVCLYPLPTTKGLQRPSVWSSGCKEIGEMEVGGGNKERGPPQQQFLLEIHVLDSENVAWRERSGLCLIPVVLQGGESTVGRGPQPPESLRFCLSFAGCLCRAERGCCGQGAPVAPGWLGKHRAVRKQPRRANVKGWELRV